MRLIDTDEVINKLKETGIIQDNELGHCVIAEINRIPTAYDVDKVVEELERLKETEQGRKDECDEEGYVGTIIVAVSANGRSLLMKFFPISFPPLIQ